MKVDEVLSRLKNVRQVAPGRYRALCPAHDDHRPSLSILVTDRGTLLLHCFAGCSYRDILAALGIHHTTKTHHHKKPTTVTIDEEFIRRGEEILCFLNNALYNAPPDVLLSYPLAEALHKKDYLEYLLDSVRISRQHAEAFKNLVWELSDLLCFEKMRNRRVSVYGR